MNDIGVEAVAHALELEVLGRLAGGEHGAVAVSDVDGAEWVLKVFRPDDERKLAHAIAVAATLRSRGVPVPDPYASGQMTIDGIANGSSVDTSSAAFTRALNACKDLEPAGFTGR